MNNINKENITENDYLEMADDCKNRIEEKEKENKKYKIDYINIKKQIGIIYGSIRILQDYLEAVSPDMAYDPISEHLTTSIRSICSMILFSEEEKKLDIYEEEIIDYGYV